MKVYIVTSGDYSDYSIRRVYLDKEKADAYVALYNRVNNSSVHCVRGEAMVEEWDVFEGSVDKYDGPVWEGIYTAYYPLIKPVVSSLDTPEYSDTLTEDWNYREIWWDEEGKPPKSKVHSIKQANSREPFSGNYEFIVIARGISRKHVEKSLQDTAAQLKAVKAGLV